MSDLQPLAGEPILLFVHGTGDGPEIDDHNTFDLLHSGLDWSVVEDFLGDEGRETRDRWEGGDRWWQTDGRLSARLNARLVSSGGAALTQPGMVHRFLWGGENDEARRDAAAYNLGQDLDRLAGHGRRIHVLAHSHGGNVVRRALELQADKPATLKSIVSITCFGAPFFRYALIPSVVSFLVNLGLLIAAGLFFLVVRKIPESLRIWLILPLFLFIVISGGRFLRAMFEVFMETRRGRRVQAEDIAWRNYCSARDEAISLLSSFNARIPLMRSAAGGGRPGVTIFQILVFAGVLVALYMISGAIRLWAEELIGLPPDTGPGFSLQAVEAFGISLLSFALAAGATAAAIAAYLALKRLGLTFVDHLVTQRLRALAYGDERGVLTGVGTCPWPGEDHVTAALPAEVEAAIEAHIEATTAGLWAKLRAGLAPGRPLIAQNIGQIVMDTLTWDELAHTVYGRVDAFIDMLAGDLVATGDWRLRDEPAGTD